MKNRLFLIFILAIDSVHCMDKEIIIGTISNTLECMRLASAIKNRVYELKAELNHKDKSGYLSIMHLCVLNPLQNQTKQGVFLECIDGVPSAIHLPFGRWQFAQPDATHEGHANKLMNQMRKSLSLIYLNENFKIKDNLKAVLELSLAH